MLLVVTVRPLRQSYHAVDSSRSSLGDAREEAEGSAGGVEGEEKAVAEAAKRRAAHDDRSGRRMLVLQLALESTRLRLYSVVYCNRIACIPVARIHAVL